MEGAEAEGGPRLKGKEVRGHGEGTDRERSGLSQGLDHRVSLRSSVTPAVDVIVLSLCFPVREVGFPGPPASRVPGGT